MTKKPTKIHGFLGSVCLFRVMVYNTTGKYVHVCCLFGLVCFQLIPVNTKCWESTDGGTL